MTQFYVAHTTATDLEFTPLEFEHPVRKTCVVADKSAYIRFKYSNGDLSNFFYLPANQAVYLDFQSANNGGGVKTIYVAGSGVVTNVRFSIIEYGTGGNIDWYK